MADDRANLSALRVMRASLEKAGRWHAALRGLDDYIDAYGRVPGTHRIIHAGEFGDVTFGMTEVQCRKAMEASGYEPIGSAPALTGGHVALWGNEKVCSYAIVDIEDGIVEACETYYGWVDLTLPRSHPWFCGTSSLYTSSEGGTGGMLGLIGVWAPGMVSAPWNADIWPEALMTLKERAAWELVSRERPFSGPPALWPPALRDIENERKALFSDRWKWLFGMQGERGDEEVLRILTERGVLSYADGEPVIARRRGPRGGAHV